MTTKHGQTREEGLQEVGRCAMASIRDMVAALQCDYDRLEELKDERESLVADCSTTEDAAADYESRIAYLKAQAELAEWDAENAEELAELVEAAGECNSEDDARERIMEDPLSIEYRSGWESDWSNVKPAEACILLTTGGPAVRLIVELEDGEPHRAYMQVQDWGTPWTDYYEEGTSEVLLTYARCFCFEV